MKISTTVAFRVTVKLNFVGDKLSSDIIVI